jgi:hypothetical protein
MTTISIKQCCSISANKQTMFNLFRKIRYRNRAERLKTVQWTVLVKQLACRVGIKTNKL